jgi:integrase/recombinase XerD
LNSYRSIKQSFAPHLIEQGADLRYIQESLGNKNITTSENYAHVSQIFLARKEGPLDHILNSNKLNANNI